jgi:hypothetical protein
VALAIILALVLTIIVTGATYLLTEELGVAAVALLICVVLSAGAVTKVAGATRNPHWQTCTVNDKDRGGKDKGTYRIYTEQCDTLADEDSWINGKHNSSNLYGRIEVGHTYQFRIVGYRSGIGSHFANILDMREVPQ